jgi:HTH-type transcriptional regulator / antitoxin HigA
MSRLAPAEVFPPGEVLQEELDARDWTQQDLAEIMGCSHRLVNEIVNAKRSITAETARGLGAALGTSSELWLNLEGAYRLRLTRSDDSEVRRRARIYELAPVAEMRRRGWIRNSRKVAELEHDLCDFFSTESIDEEPELSRHAARKSLAYTGVTSAQRAWLFRVEGLARQLEAEPYGEDKLAVGLDEIKNLLGSENGVEQVSTVLTRAGIRFLIVEHLKGTRIDGACVWLGDSEPVVALSLRYDRIDWFWHTLVHELGHVRNGDGRSEPLILDCDLVGRGSVVSENRPPIEMRADRFATDFLIPTYRMKSFLRRTGKYLSKDRIREFAHEIGVHPGVVVGQLQHMERVPYSHHREMLVRVREQVVGVALTDGWGRQP